MNTFKLHWGSGVVEEEAQVTNAYTRPTIQLLKFTEGEHAGKYQIRFCHYGHGGAFQRSPMMVDEQDVIALRAEIKANPKLHSILTQLV